MSQSWPKDSRSQSHPQSGVISGCTVLAALFPQATHAFCFTLSAFPPFHRVCVRVRACVLSPHLAALQIVSVSPDKRTLGFVHLPSPQTPQHINAHVNTHLCGQKGSEARARAHTHPRTVPPFCTRPSKQNRITICRIKPTRGHSRVVRLFFHINIPAYCEISKGSSS